MDMTQSITPKSDQWNADDLVSRSVTVTIESVVKGSAEQPVDVRLVETPGKAYRPSKSMRRVMVEAWGIESSAYTGHQLTLFRNPKIRFGGMVVGGIEISHMSHIDRPMTIALTRSKGKRESFTVAPLADAAPEPTAAEVTAASDLDTLRAMYAASGPERRAQITARVAELNTKPSTVKGPNKSATNPATDDSPTDADCDAMGAPAGGAS